jgi:hypothetical protein
MQLGNVYRVRTVSTLHFLGACAQNAALSEDLDVTGNGNTVGDREGISAGRHMRARLRELRIISKENLAWEVWLFGTSTKGGAVLADEKFLGFATFAAADAKQATGDTFFYYYLSGRDLAYQDLASLGKLYVRLVNRSAAGKSANAAGAIEIEFVLELLQGR